MISLWHSNINVPHLDKIVVAIIPNIEIIWNEFSLFFNVD